MFIPLTPTEVSTGEPTSSSMLEKVRENFDNHESRIQSVEGGAVVSYPPIILRVGGYYDFLGAYVGILKTATNFAITITGVRVYIENAGTSGSTVCDVRVSSGGGAFNSILTTLPSVAFGAGNNAVSTNAVLDATKVNLNAGDIIRLDTTAVQAEGKSFFVRIDYIKT